MKGREFLKINDGGGAKVRKLIGRGARIQKMLKTRGGREWVMPLRYCSGCLRYCTVVGLAVSVYGGLGTGTIGLYNKLCLLSQQAFGVSPAQFATSLFDSTAIALARRYGALVARGQLRQQRATYQMMLSRPRAGIRTRRRRQTE